MFSINQHRFYFESTLAAIGAVGSWTMRDVADVVSIISGVLGSIAATVALGRWVCSWSCWRRGVPPSVVILPLLLPFLLILGCASPGRVTYDARRNLVEVHQSENAKGPGYIRVEAMPSGGTVVDASTGENFDVEGVRQAFRAFRPWHLAALACIIIGGVILGTGHLPNRWGWALVCVGVGLGMAAHLIPAYGAYFAALSGLGALGGAFYLAWQSGYWKPNPAITDEKRKAAQLAFSI